VKKLRLRVAGALGLSFFFPVPWPTFDLLIPAACAEAPIQQTPRTYLRSPFIRLPLQIDERTRASLSAIKLYVKTSGGEWELVAEGPPTRAAFDYRAPKDGAYNFMFVSVDKTGRSFPANLDSRPPHQSIVVDTTPPKVSVMPFPVANREIYLQCSVDDDNPDPASIKLEYPIGANQWRALELVKPDVPGVFNVSDKSILEGKVRATVKDLAGNTTQRIVDLDDRTRSFADSGQAPSMLSDQVKSPPPLPLIPVPSDQNIVTPTIPTSSSSPLVIDLPRPAPALRTEANVSIPQVSPPPVSAYNPNREQGPAQSPEPELAIPPANSAQVPPPPQVPPPVIDPGVLPASDVQKIAAMSTNDPYFPKLEAPPPAEPALVRAEPNRSASLKVEAAPADARPMPPARGPHEIIGTSRCTLDYTVENLIVGGQPKIEFWATRDNGKTWSQVPDESGGRAPAKLVLPGEGVFGIRVVANGDGASPRQGEKPDAWVEVDTTRPEVRLLPPTLGMGPDAGTLTIQWTAHDKNLIADSINIDSANRPEGPWQRVATGVRNEGSFRWLMPAGIGPEIYLRLEATDRAGNVGQGELREPFTLPQPKVRVLGIGPGR
jgi:hypothetical protein